MQLYNMAWDEDEKDDENEKMMTMKNEKVWRWWRRGKDDNGDEEECKSLTMIKNIYE